MTQFWPAIPFLPSCETDALSSIFPVETHEPLAFRYGSLLGSPLPGLFPQVISGYFKVMLHFLNRRREEKDISIYSSFLYLYLKDKLSLFMLLRSGVISWRRGKEGWEEPGKQILLILKNECVYFVQKIKKPTLFRNHRFFTAKKEEKRKQKFLTCWLFLGRWVKEIHSSLYCLELTRFLLFCRHSGKRSHPPISSTPEWGPQLTCLLWVLIWPPYHGWCVGHPVSALHYRQGLCTALLLPVSLYAPTTDMATAVCVVFLVGSSHLIDFISVHWFPSVTNSALPRAGCVHTHEMCGITPDWYSCTWQQRLWRYVCYAYNFIWKSGLQRSI